MLSKLGWTGYCLVLSFLLLVSISMLSSLRFEAHASEAPRATVVWKIETKIPTREVAQDIVLAAPETQTLPETGPGQYTDVLAMAKSETCGLPEEARVYYLSLIRTESGFEHWDEDGSVVVNSIGAVGIGQLYTDLYYPEAPYSYSEEILDFQTNLLWSCQHFASDWDYVGGDPRLAIARYKGFLYQDPHHEYVDWALCFADTLMSGPCTLLE